MDLLQAPLKIPELIVPKFPVKESDKPVAVSTRRDYSFFYFVILLVFLLAVFEIWKRFDLKKFMSRFKK